MGPGCSAVHLSQRVKQYPHFKGEHNATFHTKDASALKESAIGSVSLFLHKKKDYYQPVIGTM
jgi:hypothetical protein